MTIELKVFMGREALAAADLVQRIYEQVFIEGPYCEGPTDFQDFADMWPGRVGQPGFRLVVAYDGGQAVGMAFGRPLPADTKWWAGMLVDVPATVTGEWLGRSFGINEIAVLPEYRRRGLARRLHDELLADTGVERAALLCRPEASAAQAAYARWGYEKVGPIRPYDGAPVYDAMVRPLRVDATR